MTRVGSIVAGVCLCVSTLGHARESSNLPQTRNQGAPQFRAGVNLVQLDVSVLDKKTHLPVRGLTVTDFSVLEDNDPQPIAAFAAVEIPDPAPVPVVAGKSVT